MYLLFCSARLADADDVAEMRAGVGVVTLESALLQILPHPGGPAIPRLGALFRVTHNTVLLCKRCRHVASEKAIRCQRS